VANGFNKNKPPTHTVVVTIDISKAFDAVDHTLLIQKISTFVRRDGTTLHPNLIRWLATYLRGRTASCIFQSAHSPKMIIHSGMPQVGVLSPDLYNFHVSDFPEEPSPTLTESYADDFQKAESSPDIPTLSTALTHPS
jgi:retron-type reverse transcriptase